MASVADDAKRRNSATPDGTIELTEMDVGLNAITRLARAKSRSSTTSSVGSAEMDPGLDVMTRLARARSRSSTTSIRSRGSTASFSQWISESSRNIGGLQAEEYHEGEKNCYLRATRHLIGVFSLWGGLCSAAAVYLFAINCPSGPLQNSYISSGRPWACFAYVVLVANVVLLSAAGREGYTVLRVWHKRKRSLLQDGRAGVESKQFEGSRRQVKYKNVVFVEEGISKRNVLLFVLTPLALFLAALAVMPRFGRDADVWRDTLKVCSGHDGFGLGCKHYNGTEIDVKNLRSDGGFLYRGLHDDAKVVHDIIPPQAIFPSSRIPKDNSECRIIASEWYDDLKP